jgi:hypothetical protein
MLADDEWAAAASGFAARPVFHIVSSGSASGVPSGALVLAAPHFPQNNSSGWKL